MTNSRRNDIEIQISVTEYEEGVLKKVHENYTRVVAHAIDCSCGLMISKIDTKPAMLVQGKLFKYIEGDDRTHTISVTPNTHNYDSEAAHYFIIRSIIGELFRGLTDDTYSYCVHMYKDNIRYNESINYRKSKSNYRMRELSDSITIDQHCTRGNKVLQKPAFEITNWSDTTPSILLVLSLLKCAAAYQSQVSVEGALDAIGLLNYISENLLFNKIESKYTWLDNTTFMSKSGDDFRYAFNSIFDIEYIISEVLKYKNNISSFHHIILIDTTQTLASNANRVSSVRELYRTIVDEYLDDENIHDTYILFGISLRLRNMILQVEDKPMDTSEELTTAINAFLKNKGGNKDV